VSEMTGVNPEFLENEEFAASILPTACVDSRRSRNTIAPPDEKLSWPRSRRSWATTMRWPPTRRWLPWAERTTSEFSVKGLFPATISI